MTNERKLELIQLAIEMQRTLNMQYHGRPDCKSCVLAETIQDILDEEKKDEQD